MTIWKGKDRKLKLSLQDKTGSKYFDIIIYAMEKMLCYRNSINSEVKEHQGGLPNSALATPVCTVAPAMTIIKLHNGQGTTFLSPSLLDMVPLS